MALNVIALVNQKGGPGKTFLTKHLSVGMLAGKHGQVAVMDFDPQMSTLKWCRKRAPRQLPPDFIEVKSLKDLGQRLADTEANGYSWCFIDTAPAINDATRAAIKHCDLAVVPVQAGTEDLEAVGAILDEIEAAGKPFFMMLNRVRKNVRANDGAVTVLAPHGRVAETQITERTQLATLGAADGTTIWEVRSDGQAVDELNKLIDYLIKLVRKAKAKGAAA